MFIIHPKKITSGLMKSINNLFSTHPDTMERIRLLEQY
jgi:Zn-dependent protease with chaperone function